MATILLQFHGSPDKGPYDIHIQCLVPTRTSIIHNQSTLFIQEVSMCISAWSQTEAKYVKNLTSGAQD